MYTCTHELVKLVSEQEVKKRIRLQVKKRRDKDAAERIRTHVTSFFHIDCAETLRNVKNINVIQSIWTVHLKQMMDNRTALMKILQNLKLKILKKYVKTQSYFTSSMTYKNYQQCLL